MRDLREGYRIRGAYLQGADLQGADLTGAVMPAGLERGPDGYARKAEVADA